MHFKHLLAHTHTQSQCSLNYDCEVMYRSILLICGADRNDPYHRIGTDHRKPQQRVQILTNQSIFYLSNPENFIFLHRQVAPFGFPDGGVLLLHRHRIVC